MNRPSCRGLRRPELGEHARILERREVTRILAQTHVAPGQ
jgi:hypothetical protein